MSGSPFVARVLAVPVLVNTIDRLLSSVLLKFPNGLLPTVLFYFPDRLLSPVFFDFTGRLLSAVLPYFGDRLLALMIMPMRQVAGVVTRIVWNARWHEGWIPAPL